MAATSTRLPTSPTTAWFNDQMDEVKPSKSDINLLILDYLTAEGYATAAERFSREANLKPIEQHESVLNRKKIQRDIHLGSIQDAIEAINDLNPQILENDSALHFSLLRLQLIELIRENNALSDQNIAKVIEFATTQLAPKAPANPQFLADLEGAMVLLICPPETLEPKLKELLHPDLRKQVADNVNKALLSSQGERRNAAIRKLVKLRSWAENTARAQKLEALPQENGPGSSLDIGLDEDTMGDVDNNENDEAMKL